MSNPKVLLCSNGHQQPPNADRFCIYCGDDLTAARTKSSRAVVPQPSSQPVPQQFPPSPSVKCATCGGSGERLNPGKVVCEECSWLRPLVPGYHLNTKAFAWAADAKAMSVLRSITPLNAVAETVSEKVGRRWIESTFNGVLLGEKQLPEIYGQAVRAARLLGVSHMPDVYLSGERAWDCLTFGTDKDSFIVVGSALASSFRGPDMLFLLAREIGHCRAGHALWKSVIRFLRGEQGPAKGFMAGGIINAVLSPTALIEGALEMPLLAWARQAEITADRAGMLALGDEEVARRVLLSWSLKSPLMFRQINIEAWLEQQADDMDNYSRLSEMTTTSTPYLGPRLRLLTEFSRSQELNYWRKYISDSIGRGKSKAKPKLPAAPVDEEVIRLKCATCKTPMRIPQKVLAGKDVLPVKCPNPQCGKINRIQKKSANPAPAPKVTKAAKSPKTQKPKKNEEDMNVVD